MRWLSCFAVLASAVLIAWAVPAEGQAPGKEEGLPAPKQPPSGSPGTPAPGAPGGQPYYPGMPGLGGYPPNPYGGGYPPYGAYGFYGKPGVTVPTSQAEVNIYDDYYEPAVVYVTPGGSVRWINQGKRVHTVTGYARGFNSGDLNPGDTYTFKLPRDLNYFYYCRHHRLQMNGAIVVRNAPRQRMRYPFSPGG